MDSEREAKKLRLFGPLLVPGLLQTEGYARAVFGTRFGVTDEEIDEQVAARLQRQEILVKDEPPALWVIVDEWALRRAVGGPYVMREQIVQLIEASRRPNVVDRREDVRYPPRLLGYAGPRGAPVGGLASTPGGSSKVMDLSHLTWRKSSHSGANGGECVEVASAGQSHVAVRDSKNPNGPGLAFAASAWESVMQRMRDATLERG